ncbi:MAG: DUF72 domain-containing protein [Acidobacteria bacterium]|nr:DUF72 domain-containing protein [Acidobacteriota bacterium]
MGNLFAGTSGFTYPQWKPAFYPKDLPSKKFLEYYSSRLNCVEINYTFRRLAAASTLANWIGATPEGFVFSCKAHQRLSHFLRLRNAEEFTAAFFRSLEPLFEAKKLGPVLFQFPPQFPCDLALLANYLTLLPRGVRSAFEFRHTSWLNELVYDLLEKHNACLCLAESEKLEIPRVITADFVYFRLRKPQYSVEDRKAVAAAVRQILEGGKNVYVFFKHEDSPDGALHAEELLKGISA